MVKKEKEYKEKPVGTVVEGEVCLDPRKPVGRIAYNDLNIFEQVTVPDVAPSLSAMVRSGVVPAGSSTLYTSPDFETDDEAHDGPDYSKLNNLDLVEKEEFVQEWEKDPRNYEKKEESSEASAAEGKADESSKAEPPSKGGEQGHV